MDIISSPPLNIILNSGWALTSSRITRIIQARTLDDASPYGAYRSTVRQIFPPRRQARRHHTRLYRQLSQPGAGEPHDLTPTTMVARFMQLRAYAKSEYRKVFQLSLRYNPLEQASLSYLMQIGDYQIYQSTPLDYRLDKSFCGSVHDESLLVADWYIQSQIESMAAASAVRQKYTSYWPVFWLIIAMTVLPLPIAAPPTTNFAAAG